MDTAVYIHSSKTALVTTQTPERYHHHLTYNKVKILHYKCCIQTLYSIVKSKSSAIFPPVVARLKIHVKLDRFGPVVPNLGP